MVVLVPFLLISAVFSRVTVTILELSVRTAAGAPPSQPNFNIEVVVRKNGLELANGSSGGGHAEEGQRYDLEKLITECCCRLQRSIYPQKEDASVLMDTPYRI